MLTQLTDQDVSFLYAETAETPAHVGSLSLVELPEGRRSEFFADYRATIASRMALIPFMHSRLASIPLDLDRPFWIEDEHVDLDHHIRRATAPAPGRFRDLEALVAVLHASPLDRSRPLWQIYVIDGLASGHVALYVKVHHAAMDGASSQALLATMYDPTPTPRTLPRPEADGRNHRGDVANLVHSLLAHRVQQAIRAVQYVPELLAALSHVVLPDPVTLRYRPFPRWLRGPTTPLNVGITARRVYAARTLPLPTIKRLARLTGTKVNDVVLAICSGALRDHLEDQRALPARPLIAMVPVSPRLPTELASANHNSLFLCSLASDVADPYERLLAIHESSVDQRRRLEVWNELPLPDISVPGVSWIVRRLVERYGRSRLAGRPPLLGNLTISNIPGPTAPLYIAGAKVLSIYPCSIPFHGQALNITVESYGDRLDVGLIACQRAVPELAQLADRLWVALAALQDAVARRCPAPRTASPSVDCPERGRDHDAGSVAIAPPRAHPAAHTTSSTNGHRPAIRVL